MDKKNFPTLLLICLANAIIYTLPYIQNTYYDAMRISYGFSHVEMGNLIGVYGLANIVGYILGGMAADSFDTRTLFVFSLSATGLTGFFSAIFPPYMSMLILSVVWSITTMLTFWPALIKATKNLADANHQGRIFGIKETCVCLITLALSMLGLWIFNKAGENLSLLILFYSSLHILSAILIFIFMPKTKVKHHVSAKSIFGNIKYIVKIKGIWLIGGVIFFGTCISIFLSKLSPFLTTVGGLSASAVAFITIISTNGFANIGSVIGGNLCDKTGSPAKYIGIVMILCCIFSIVFTFMPWGRETVRTLVVMSVMFRIINGALRAAYFATMSQVEIPSELVGTASGVISILGYSPDAFMYTLCGSVLERFQPSVSFKIIFIGLIVACLLGSLLCLALHNYTLKTKQPYKHVSTQ